MSPEINCLAYIMYEICSDEQSSDESICTCTFRTFSSKSKSTSIHKKFLSRPRGTKKLKFFNRCRG